MSDSRNEPANRERERERERERMNQKYRVKYKFKGEWIGARPAPRSRAEDIFYTTPKPYWFETVESANKFCSAVRAEAKRLWPKERVIVCVTSMPWPTASERNIGVQP